MFATPAGGARHVRAVCDEKHIAEEIVINVRIADRSKWTFSINWPSVRGVIECEVSRKCRAKCSSVSLSKRFWEMRVTP